MIRAQLTYRMTLLLLVHLQRLLFTWTARAFADDGTHRRDYYGDGVFLARACCCTPVTVDGRGTHVQGRAIAPPSLKIRHAHDNCIADRDGGNRGFLTHCVTTI